MRVAIILPWVGGSMPPYLSFTCHTMVGGFKTATLLLFHESIQKGSVPIPCRTASNIIVQELEDGGIAALHIHRILEAGSWSKRPTTPIMHKKLRRLFQVSPASLSEFKPSWGWVFGDYLSGFSHWTYTDADVVFGRLASVYHSLHNYLVSCDA